MGGLAFFFMLGGWVGGWVGLYLVEGDVGRVVEVLASLEGKIDAQASVL